MTAFVHSSFPLLAFHQSLMPCRFTPVTRNGTLFAFFRGSTFMKQEHPVQARKAEC